MLSAWIDDRSPQGYSPADGRARVLILRRPHRLGLLYTSREGLLLEGLLGVPGVRLPSTVL